MMRIIGMMLVLLICASAHAQVTLNNLDNAGNQLSHYDEVGNQLEIHGGNILQVGNTYYAYSDVQGCGFLFDTGAATPWCGIKAWKTTDFLNWTPLGFVFDPTTTYWQDHCSTPSSGIGACFGIRMYYNAANNNYVGWMTQGGEGAFQSIEHVMVFTCTTPAGVADGGTCAPASPQPSNFVNGPVASDIRGFLDPVSGNFYFIYNNIVGSNVELFIEQANSSYTDSAGGTSDNLGASVLGESPYLFYRSGTYYAGYGGSCSYCAASASYVTSSSILGTYSAPVSLLANACGGQQRLDTITTNGGATTVYLWGSEVWANGLPNQGIANTFLQPLSFTGSAINAPSCSSATASIPGLSGTFTPPVGQPDQTSFSEDAFANHCDVGGDIWRMQTFIPTVNTLVSVKIPLGQNNGTCSLGHSCNTQITGNLNVDLDTVDASNNPVTTLATATITPSQALWTTTLFTLIFNQLVTPGTTYAIVLRAPTVASGGVDGCFSYGLYTGNSPSPYSRGIERMSTNSGSSWTTEANSALLFSTYGPGAMPTPMGGLAANDNALTIGEKRRIATR